MLYCHLGYSEGIGLHAVLKKYRDIGKFKMSCVLSMAESASVGNVLGIAESASVGKNKHSF